MPDALSDTATCYVDLRLPCVLVECPLYEKVSQKYYHQVAKYLRFTNDYSDLR